LKVLEQYSAGHMEIRILKNGIVAEVCDAGLRKKFEPAKQAKCENAVVAHVVSVTGNHQ